MERFLVSVLGGVLVLYTESGRYLLHRVWYIYICEQEVKGVYFPGLGNLKESNDVVFIFTNIINRFLLCL